MIIGMDDTDSKTRGMCTTYLGALMLEKITPFAKTVKPYLFRLNPNVRFKTRGNAAVALDITLNTQRDVAKVKQICYDLIEKLSIFDDDNTNPGIVFLNKNHAGKISGELETFSLDAVRDFITIREARIFLNKEQIEHKGYKNGRGLIGALAAAGFAYNGLPDYTYELIAYRSRENRAKKRFLVEETAWAADAASYPHTWDTVDHHNNKIVFAPHGPDPVLFGIRGDKPGAIKSAFKSIRSEPIERYLLYTTNQGTDLHIIPGRIKDTREGSSYKIKGTINTTPTTIPGGHIIFSLEDGTGSLDCAAYEPTKNFRELIKKLTKGDIVVVYGSVKNNTLNIEKIKIEELTKRTLIKNPLCSCGKRMKSAGKNQGYRCKKCKTTTNKPEITELHPQVETGYYETPPVARRHLAKPLIRCRDKRGVHPSR